jgi:hypothetical protein
MGDRVALGSGYPVDERTKNWLQQSVNPVLGWDGRVARFSWRTVLDMMEGKGAKVLEADWPGDDNEADNQDFSEVEMLRMKKDCRTGAEVRYTLTFDSKVLSPS